MFVTVLVEVVETVDVVVGTSVVKAVTVEVTSSGKTVDVVLIVLVLVEVI